ncbi:phage tail length tape measure family protein [Acidovorax kalamii]|uniref:Bacteriophage tail tape measure N-terminal domain-containing protein n=1 Tax=Acidovorax kalamii TaxID=2004485 RepID=A0A235ENY8_9BURK|nr:phage tail length tape measure family protein [Acidovorax kalamii]OYD50720.1 hypothetical protein CBY09_08290 [Acidovorax kalamii]
MTSDLRIQGEVVVNSEQAESAFNRVGDKAQQMANEVATSATKAGQAVDKIGDGAGASAEKFTRAESRISASIKRATNELELLGKTASQRLEFNISDKGLDPKKFEPMLQRLREVEQRARDAEAAATGSLNNMGMSARATAAAMRGVPAQFQDIIVSLQGGQAPMTVLLQQGSQLSGMFGGAGNAARALGTYIVGLVNPLTVAAAAVAGLGFAMYSLNGKDAALRDLSAQLIGTGRASAAAVGDIKALVNELNTVPGVSKAAATAIIGEFAKVSGLGSSLFKGLGSSVADFAAATGTDLPTAAKKLAEAFADPAKGAKALEETLGTLTAAQILTITKMAEMGDKSGAQAALLDALKQATEGLAKQGMTPLGEATDKMSNAWDRLTTSVGNSSAFRTANDWLAKLIEKTAELTVRLSQMQPPTWLKYMPGIGPAIGAASLFAGPEASSGGSRSVSGKVGTVEGGATGSWGPTSQEMESQVKAALDLTKSYESQSAAMEKLRGVAKVAKDALKELEAQNRGNSVEAKELRERITGVNEKLAEMAKKGQGDVKAEQNAYETLISSIRAKIEENKQELAGNRALTDSQKIRIKLDEDLAAGRLKLTAVRKAEVLLDLESLSVQEKLALAAKDALKVAQTRQALREKETDSISAWLAAQDAAASAALASARERTTGLQDEGRALALSTSANISLAEAVERVAQARLLEKQAQFVEGSEGYLNIQREIDARKELLVLIRSNEANKKFISDWKDSVSAYEDIFRRGFADMLNNGKDGWKSFTRSLVTTFKTSVADQIYKMFAQPFVVNIVGNLLGLVGGGAAQAVAGAASGGSALGTIGNAASGLSALTGTFGMGLRAGLSGLFGEAGLAGTISAGTTAIGAGNIAGGLGTLAGPLALVGGGLLVLNSLLKDTKGETRTGGQFGVSFDGTVTNQRRGETYTYQGQQFDRDFSNGQRNALIAGQAYRLEGDPVQNEQAIRDAVSGTASGINAFLKALGSKATLTGFSAGLETSGKGRGGVFAGGILSDGTAFGESGKGDNYAGTLYEKFSTNSPDFKTALENFTLDLKQSTIQALQSVTDIPETVKKMLKGVDAEGLGEEAANALLESINAQIVGVQNLTSAFEAMGLDKLADMGFDAAAGLAAASGGFDKLQSNLNTYYDNFTTEDQKRANLQKQLDKQFAALGIDVPKNREEFSRLVESTLEQAEVQDKTRAALSKQINDAIAGAGKDGFTLADAGARSIVSGINPALLGNAEADPALAGKLDGFLSGVSDLAGKGLDPAAFQEGLSGLIAVNSEVLGIGKDASQTAAALLALSGTFAELNESADDAAARIAKEQADARDKALRGLERAIAKEKEALQTQIDVAQDVASTMGGLFDLLKSNVRELYGEVDSTRAMLAVQGNDFITQALATARTTGYLPDETQLADAISAARGGLDSSGYASQFEMDRDRLVLAGKLSELEGLTGKQLTSAERTVKELEAQSEQLNQTLDYWKEQIEIASGTYEATLSVVDAIKNLEALMFPKTASSDKGKGSAAGSVGGITWGGSSNVSDKYFTPGSYTGGTFYQGVSLEQEQRLDKYAAGYHAFDGTGDAAGLNKWIADNKLTPEDLAGLSGLYESDWERWYKANNIPAFAVGTNYVPRDMLAQIHEGEAIVPKAYNPAANPGMSGSGQTEALLTALLEQNARIETRLAAIEGHAQDTSRATNGNPISPVPVALVEDETV